MWTLTKGRAGVRQAMLLLVLLLLGGCNLGFDVEEFGPLPAVEDDAGNNDQDTDGEDEEPIPPGCDDNDGDSFGFGLDCPKDQIDCDDTRAFVFPGAEELCDGLDNDCDNATDENEAGRPLSRPCYTGEPAELEVSEGACAEGVVLCENGQFPMPVTADKCVGQTLPSDFGERSERGICDDIDNDCDGTVDPECECPFVGAEDECYSAGPPERAGVGICARGVRTCIETDDGLRVWGECQNDVAPGEETCANEGSDDDCDGEVDNVADLGDACQSPEPGRCRPGTIACEDGEPVCLPNLAPIEEVCDGLDNDCDGTVDNGVANACGGCVALNAAPGDACGTCRDGLQTCQEDGTLACVGARPLNACGGCALLEDQPNEVCGDCGRVICNGTEETTCADPGRNACGGCGPINGGELLGSRCDVCGTFVCQGGNNITCEDPGANACGGCVDLNNQPNTVCGPCQDGTFVCNDGGDSVRCQGASTLNACGGCGTLQGAPNTPCGQCGVFRCDPDNVGRLLCDDPGQNACGGCGPLNDELGQPCGQCGTFACQNGNTACIDPGRNSCGGCAELQSDEGDDCGVCGTIECTSPNSIQCNDPGQNACGGCEPLQGTPNTSCGQCGTFKCAIDPDFVVCDDPGQNACGGCGDIIGGQLGQSCGTCGTFVCDGTNATRCDDPGLNVCGACGDLPNVPGSQCGECAAFRCATFGNPVCDDRACFDPFILFRIYNYVVGMPGFDIEIDGGLDVDGFGYEFRTFYVQAPAIGHVIKLWEPGADKNVDPPLLTRNFSKAPGAEVTAMIIGQAGVPGVDWDLVFFDDDNQPVPGQIKMRFIHAFPDRPVPVNVLVDGNTVFTGVPYKGSSAYITIPAPAFRISVVQQGQQFPFATFNLNTALFGGSVYSMIHFGRENDGNFPNRLRTERDREIQFFNPF